MRPYLRPLLEPLTLDEIAAQMHYSRRMVEVAWGEIKVAMALPDSTSIARLALLRLALGLDPCVCERFAAELSA